MTTHDDHNNGQNFTPHNPYEAEARERWGNTDAYKQSQERVGKMTKEQFEQVGKDAEEITQKIAALAEAGSTPESPEVQEQVAAHYNWLRNFYEPSLEMYRGLGSMYVDDPRFAANYEKYRPGMAVFMRDAMHAYCNAQGV